MRNNAYNIVLLCLFSFFSAGCTPEYEKNIREGIQLYKKGDSKKSVQLIRDGIITASILREIKASKPEFQDSIIYETGKKNITLYTPREASFDIPPQYRMIAYDDREHHVAFSNGSGIMVFNKRNSLIADITIAPNKKKPIKGIAFVMGTLVYFQDGKLFSYFIHDKSTAPYIKGKTFKPPFKLGPYNVFMTTSPGHLSIIIGFAGSYYLSVIDSQTRKIVLKDKNVSSTQIHIARNALYCIAGSPGDWILEKVSLKPRNKKPLNRFSRLVDIQLFGRGVIFENHKGLWLFEYTDEQSIPVPFPFEFKNSVISYKNKLYQADFNIFAQKMKMVATQIPRLFVRK